MPDGIDVVSEAIALREHGFAQQVVLRGEPAVDSARRQARLTDDVLDLGARVALGREHPSGGVEQLCPQRIVGEFLH